MKTTHELYKYALALLLAVMGGVSAWGQVRGDLYRNQYRNGGYNIDTDDKIIKHKPAKWYSFLNSISDEAKAMDTFDDDNTNAMIDAAMSNAEKIQAAHTYIDTIYMHKGSSIILNLPDKMNDANLNSTSYQRWYSYRTGGTFATGETGRSEVVDLLTPEVNGTFYRFGNGYVGNPIGTNMHRANFYFPTDAEFQRWFGDEHSEYRDNSWYVVACDVSVYDDFAENYRPGGSSFSVYNPYEPTLTPVAGA